MEENIIDVVKDMRNSLQHNAAWAEDETERRKFDNKINSRVESGGSVHTPEETEI